MTSERSPSNVLPYLAITSIPILFGSYYIVTKIVNETIPVFWMAGLRMFFAILGFLPFVKNLRRTDRHSLKYAFYLALIFFIGIIAQAEGLKTVTAGKSGFISGLFVILTPFLSWILFRTKIPRFLVIPISITLLGLFVMFYDSTTQFFNVGIGELLNFVGAISIALHIVVLGKGIKKGDVFCMAFYQCVFMFLFSIIAALLFKQTYSFSEISTREWGLLVYLGIAAGTIPFLLQNWGQRTIKDSVAALIISVEPVFATFFGFLFGDEHLTWQIVIGGSIIFLGLIITILVQQKQASVLLDE